MPFLTTTFPVKQLLFIFSIFYALTSEQKQKRLAFTASTGSNFTTGYKNTCKYHLTHLMCCNSKWCNAAEIINCHEMSSLWLTISNVLVCERLVPVQICVVNRFRLN